MEPQFSEQWRQGVNQDSGRARKASRVDIEMAQADWSSFPAQQVEEVQ